MMISIIVVAVRIVRMTVGRRRVGKTALLLRSSAEKKRLYLFVSRNSEAVLCRQFQQQASGRWACRFTVQSIVLPMTGISLYAHCHASGLLPASFLAVRNFVRM
jgi:hypothetical protein